MKRTSFIKSLIAATFAVAVLFTVSVHEVHYLFVAHHEVEQNCINHLHQADSHGDCNVCKFDVSFFTEVIQKSQLPFAIVTLARVQVYYQSYTYVQAVTANPLRGPPTIA